MYENGIGVPKDGAEAFQWLRKAAQSTQPSAALVASDALYNLGTLSYYGNGVPKDYDLAAHWFREAANRGNAQAQFYLGYMFADGNGVPKDSAEAANW